MRPRPTVLTVVALLAAALALPDPTAVADGHVQTFVAFDPAAGEFPEGVAVGKTGSLYASLTFRDEIRRIDPDGTQRVLAVFTRGTSPAGLALDPNGVVYAAASAFDPETGRTDPALRGVYRVEGDGATARLPGTGAIRFPNDLTLDPQGTLYTTDTIDGAVWRVPRHGSAHLWLRHRLLEGNGAMGFGFPIGANGIAFRHNRVVVANTERGLLVDIPVQPDGSAGEPTVIAESPALFGADGIAFDVHGAVYVASAAQNTVVRVRHDAAIDTLATAADGLNQPSTLAFGAGRLAKRSQLVANFSVFAPAAHTGRADSASRATGATRAIDRVGMSP